ncbi:MAG: glutamate-1-semialdehyde 2,1-aminomutase [Candidatus Omnitrophica bacterium]|nr:glutamate-1-semialdehyde 2,1-aminomutase [Candidatus Omnitrophota bacterium]
MKTKNSKKYFARARKVLVGGVNSPVRAFKTVGGGPLVMARGRGSRLFDVDGNSYTDYCLSWGALILGHNHPEVVKAVKSSITLGSSFGATTKPEIEIAQLIAKHVPSIDMLRFVNSGTEAAMSAVRLARAFTKRDKIIKFDGCYHGHCDDLLASAGSGVAGLPASSSEGVPAGHVRNTFSLPYNDANELGIVIERHWKDIACVIIEPVAGNMGVIVPDMEFLNTLRQLTKKYGIVLIFDEVMTGFRGNLGGAQADFGIVPDMTCLGKIIGGGFPVGAYGGRADIMRHLAPLGGVYQAGTFSGNPMVMAAGLATLKNLTPQAYKDLNRACDVFTRGLNLFLAAAGLPAHLVNYKSMVSVRLSKDPARNYADAQAAAFDRVYAKLFHGLLSNGVYWPPANLETFFVSTEHAATDLNRLSGQIRKFFVQSKP